MWMSRTSVAHQPKSALEQQVSFLKAIASEYALSPCFLEQWLPLAAMRPQQSHQDGLNATCNLTGVHASLFMFNSTITLCNAGRCPDLAALRHSQVATVWQGT
jgi:hypothetical protein